MSSPTVDVSIGAQMQGIPPPKDGFIRSRQLQFQIQMLSEHPELDYILVEQNGAVGLSSIVFPEPRHKTILRRIRNRAFHDGDRACVWALCNMIVNIIGLGDGFHGLRTQLRDEYGHDVADVCLDEAGELLEAAALNVLETGSL